jgi:hypothetical protein
MTTLEGLLREIDQQREAGEYLQQQKEQGSRHQ